jgi:two-component system, OmpR family, sensor histidine kinase MtrB
VTVDLAAGGDSFAISVRDAGAGIPVEEQELIFEKFYRSDPKLTRAPSGTGLGLYIARELAERMDGTLNVQSLSGSGTAFVLTLPRL